MSQDLYVLFTDGAREVMRLADREARRIGHHYIDDNHVLVGLIMQHIGIAGTALNGFEVDLKQVQAEVQKFVETSSDPVTETTLSRTPRVAELIKHASEEADRLEHKYIGTEHLLLGMIRLQESVAVQVLQNLGLVLEDVRERVLDLVLTEVVDFTPEDRGLACTGDRSLRFLLDDIFAQAADRGYAVSMIQVHCRKKYLLK